jgi:branched-chain amino acid transport system ATP-binding protein
VFPILAERANARARSLSGGQQQMLTLPQAFVARPKALLCDEPSLGLAMARMPPILKFLRDWAASGTAVIIVEQHIDLALEIADRALLLERGAFSFTGTADEFRAVMRPRAAVESRASHETTTATASSERA